MNVVDRFMNLVAMLWREVLKFGAVGGLAWIIDNGIYTLLWHGPMAESTIKARASSRQLQPPCSRGSPTDTGRSGTAARNGCGRNSPCS